MSLTVLDADDWCRHVGLRGRVVAVDAGPRLKDIDRIFRHYRGEAYPNRDSARFSVWIEIESWHAWNA